MNKTEKKKWIIEYIKQYGWQDIFMTEFVDAYIENCNPNIVQSTLWGAAKVPELGKYLGELYKEKILDRFVVKLNYQCDGFPKWCYGYSIRP